MFLAGALLHPLSAVWAQDKPVAAPSQLPSDSALDALFASQNWGALASALRTPANFDDLVRGMNWLRPKVTDGGGGLFFVLMYSNDLWSAGRSMKTEDPNR